MAPNGLKRGAATSLGKDVVALAGEDLAAALDQQLLIIADQNTDRRIGLCVVAHEIAREERAEAAPAGQTALGCVRGNLHRPGEWGNRAALGRIVPPLRRDN